MDNGLHACICFLILPACLYGLAYYGVYKHNERWARWEELTKKMWK
jgi:hypothetical protein